MDLLNKKNQKEIWLMQLDKPYAFLYPFDGEAFVCILFNNDPFISNEEQNKISEDLVASNCRYAVCAGDDSSSWDNSIDMAYISTDENYDPPDDTMVMTTWHDDETISDIMFFGLNNTNFDYHDFKKYLVLFIGSKEGLRDEIEEAIKNEWVELGKC
jgi:hypothetical protein